MEVSAKENINIEEAFMTLVREIVAKIQQKQNKTTSHVQQSKVVVDKKQLDQNETSRPAEKHSTTHQQHSDYDGYQKASGSQIKHVTVDSKSKEVFDKSTVSTAVLSESLSEKEQQVYKTKRQLEEQKKRALEAGEIIQLLRVEKEQYQQLIEDKNHEIQQSYEANQSLQGRLMQLEEAVQATRQQLQEKEHQVSKNLESLQDIQSRLQQSEEAVQVARQQVKEKEQQVSRSVNTIQTLESRVQVLEEEATETQQHVTELEQQLHQAELRLMNSDQVFQDIFQRLLGQLPQSQPHWVVQRNEIQLTGEELGTGGWASVKVALFRGQRVAAKCLHRQIISAHNTRLFTREMNMAAQARHPNLLQFIGATMDNNPIILTELMPTSLRRILEQGVRLTRRQITSIASDVARALNYLHLNTPDPIIHRDISSANVLLEEFGDNYKAKVSDYGSANFARYTSTAGPGNPLYSAPESGEPRRQTVKMDVYSFGLLLVEMCSGELFDNHEELIRTRISDWPEMVGIIHPCIRQDPKRRPNMDGVLTQLTQIQ